MTGEISRLEEELVYAFGLFDNWVQRYEYIIDRGKKLEELPDELKTDDRLVPGCQSKVWLDINIVNGKVIIKADSESLIVKGITSLIIYVYSGVDPKEVANSKFDVFDTIGLGMHLSNSRANGLNSMIEKIRSYAQENT